MKIVASESGIFASIIIAHLSMHVKFVLHFVIQFFFDTLSKSTAKVLIETLPKHDLFWRQRNALRMFNLGGLSTVKCHNDIAIYIWTEKFAT